MRPLARLVTAGMASASAELGQEGLGPQPKPGGSPAFPRALTGRKAVAGRLVSLGQPVSDKKIDFLFFFYYLKVEMVWKMFDYKKFAPNLFK
jgi:hypothetical protein